MDDYESKIQAIIEDPNTDGNSFCLLMGILRLVLASGIKPDEAISIVKNPENGVGLDSIEALIDQAIEKFDAVVAERDALMAARG